MIIYRRDGRECFNDYGLSFILSISAVSAIFLVNVSSTAADRMSLYFIPIQIIVFSRLHILLKGKVNPDSQR